MSTSQFSDVTPYFHDNSVTKLQPSRIAAVSLIVRFADLLSFCERELARLTEIREEQREGRFQRLEEKRAMIRRMVNPPASAAAPSKHERKAKKAGQAKAKHDHHEPESRTGPLPQLASPEEIVLHREGNTAGMRGKIA